MAVIYPDYPDHGEGDWDVPLLALLSDLVTQGNSHELAIANLGNGGTGFISLSQNSNGTWNLSLTGLPTASGGAIGYDGGTQF